VHLPQHKKWYLVRKHERKKFKKIIWAHHSSQKKCGFFSSVVSPSLIFFAQVFYCVFGGFVTRGFQKPDNFFRSRQKK
jgi:hypothetical protein